MGKSGTWWPRGYCRSFHERRGKLQSPVEDWLVLCSPRFLSSHKVTAPGGGWQHLCSASSQEQRLPCQSLGSPSMWLQVPLGEKHCSSCPSKVMTPQKPLLKGDSSRTSRPRSQQGWGFCLYHHSEVPFCSRSTEIFILFFYIDYAISLSIMVGFDQRLRVRHPECSKAWGHCAILTWSSSTKALTALNSKKD